MEITLAEIAQWFGVGSALSLVPYGFFFCVRSVWAGVQMIGEDSVEHSDR